MQRKTFLTIVVAVASAGSAMPLAMGEHETLSDLPTDPIQFYTTAECGGVAPQVRFCGAFGQVGGTLLARGLARAEGDPEFWGTIRIHVEQVFSPNQWTDVVCHVAGKASVCYDAGGVPGLQFGPFPLVRGYVHLYASADGIGPWTAYVGAFQGLPQTPI